MNENSKCQPYAVTEILMHQKAYKVVAEKKTLKGKQNLDSYECSLKRTK